MTISKRFTEQHPGRPLRALALAAGLVALGTAGVAGAQTGGTIAGSPHDFVGGTAQDVTGGGTNPLPAGTGICVFCHTPHGSDIGAAVPLWNKDISTPPTYQRYSELGTVTLDGTENTITGSMSLACLSCHDGTQAMDSVINAPGSGLGSGNLGAGTMMAGTPVPNLETDLRDDHPISIQYAGGGCDDSGGTPACPSLADVDFDTPESDTINGTPIWWLEVGTATVAGTPLPSNDVGTRSKHDLLLYTRPAVAGGGATGNEPFVECGSCHDPHNGDTQPVSFLRVDNDGSQICLACHLK